MHLMLTLSFVIYFQQIFSHLITSSEDSDRLVYQRDNSTDFGPPPLSFVVNVPDVVNGSTYFVPNCTVNNCTSPYGLPWTTPPPARRFMKRAEPEGIDPDIRGSTLRDNYINADNRWYVRTARSDGTRVRVWRNTLGHPPHFVTIPQDPQIDPTYDVDFVLHPWVLSQYAHTNMHSPLAGAMEDIQHLSAGLSETGDIRLDPRLLHALQSENNLLGAGVDMHAARSNGFTFRNLPVNDATAAAEAAFLLEMEGTVLLPRYDAAAARIASILGQVYPRSAGRISHTFRIFAETLRVNYVSRMRESLRRAGYDNNGNPVTRWGDPNHPWTELDPQSMRVMFFQNMNLGPSG